MPRSCPAATAPARSPGSSSGSWRCPHPRRCASARQTGLPAQGRPPCQSGALSGPAHAPCSGGTSSALPAWAAAGSTKARPWPSPQCASSRPRGGSTTTWCRGCTCPAGASLR
eukprot:358731-Chlamydomonas_euryale.AAC.6